MTDTPLTVEEVKEIWEHERNLGRHGAKIARLCVDYAKRRCQIAYPEADMVA